MGIHVKKILNSPIDSNSFVVFSTENKCCFILDPGTKESEELISFLNQYELQPEFIFLTHEHFDHIWGLEKLRNMFSLKVISSEICSDNLTDNKKNLSVFYDQKGFTCNRSDILITEEYIEINWVNGTIEVLATPGHSEGSVCIAIDNLLFTGDTLLKNNRCNTKLPGGDKVKLLDSYERIFLRYSSDMIVLPGHDKSFSLSEINKDYLK